MPEQVHGPVDGPVDGPGARPRGRLSRRTLLAAVPGVALAGAVGGSTETLLHGYPRRHLHYQTIALAAPTSRARVLEVSELAREGSRVLAASAQADVLVDDEDSWLGRAEGLDDVPVTWRDAARDALLDLRVHTLAGGATIAAWSLPWRYVWPRDSAFVLAAYARFGLLDDARRVLGFLQRTLPAVGEFQARYLPDGSGVPDQRGIQRDGSGWVLWGAQQWARSLPRAGRRAAVAEFAPLVTTAADACAVMTAGGTQLPPPSPDYWEIGERATTLGTAAPVLSGLRAAAELHGMVGDRDRSQEFARMGRRFATVVRDTYGPGYPRYAGDSAMDTAVTFLLPPFADEADHDVVQAWQHAREVMRRPGGGHAPGERWIPDGISWTPETALFGLSAAASGLDHEATQELDWLASHRTAVGSMPEKVLPDGSPAAVAPLAWTAASFLLAVRS